MRTEHKKLMDLRFFHESYVLNLSKFLIASNAQSGGILYITTLFCARITIVISDFNFKIFLLRASKNVFSF